MEHKQHPLCPRKRIQTLDLNIRKIRFLVANAQMLAECSGSKGGANTEPDPLVKEPLFTPQNPAH